MRIRRCFPILTRIAAERVFATTDTKCKTTASLARSYLMAVNKIIKKKNHPQSFFDNLLEVFELETTTHEDITAILKKALSRE